MSPLRDRAYLDSLRDERCVITGRQTSEFEAVDPAHIGVNGMSSKAGDDCALPILHSVHQDMHQRGACTVLRRVIPDDVLIAALQAYARERYRRAKHG